MDPKVVNLGSDTYGVWKGTHGVEGSGVFVEVDHEGGAPMVAIEGELCHPAEVLILGAFLAAAASFAEQGDDWPTALRKAAEGGA